MLGVIVLFFLSYALLWFNSREHITDLGIRLTRQRAKEFFIGFLLMALFCAINLLGQAYIKGIVFTINPEYKIYNALQGLWWTGKSAIFEELIFRGALLYILIKHMGIFKACLISAVAFGVYHWFSYGMIGGRLIPMIYVFLLTGATGWMFAFAFANTKSLFAPFGLHLGWILTSIVVFSDGPLGTQLLIAHGAEVELGGWATLVFFLFQAALIPALVTCYLMRKYPSDKTEV